MLKPIKSDQNFRQVFIQKSSNVGYKLTAEDTDSMHLTVTKPSRTALPRWLTPKSTKDNIIRNQPSGTRQPDPSVKKSNLHFTLSTAYKEGFLFS